MNNTVVATVIAITIVSVITGALVALSKLSKMLTGDDEPNDIPLDDLLEETDDEGSYVSAFMPTHVERED